MVVDVTGGSGSQWSAGWWTLEGSDVSRVDGS